MPEMIFVCESDHGIWRTYVDAPGIVQGGFSIWLVSSEQVKSLSSRQRAFFQTALAEIIGCSDFIVTKQEGFQASLLGP